MILLNVPVESEHLSSKANVQNSKHRRAADTAEKSLLLLIIL